MLSFEPLPLCNVCGLKEQSPGFEQCEDCGGLAAAPEYEDDFWNGTPQLKTYYSKALLSRLVPALTNATHGLTSPTPPHSGSIIKK